MDTTYPLVDLEMAYLDWHRSRGSTPATIAKYESSFRLFQRFSQGKPQDSRLLSTETFRAFAAWMRETPNKGQRGVTKRSEVSIHGYLKDYRAFIRWLQKEELVTRIITIDLPKLPGRLFTVLSQEDLDKIWDSSFLKGDGALCCRNRAMIGLMLDTGLRPFDRSPFPCLLGLVLGLGQLERATVGRLAPEQIGVLAVYPRGRRRATVRAGPAVLVILGHCPTPFVELSYGPCSRGSRLGHKEACISGLADLSILVEGDKN
jgi:integrase